MRKFILAISLIAAAAPAIAQDQGRQMTFKDLLGGTAVPLTLKLKDLDGSWRRMTVSGQFDMGGMTQMLASMWGGASGNAYYTKGETVMIASETYIVAYKLPASGGMDLSKILQQGGAPNAKPPVAPKLTPDSQINLSLLNVRTSGNLTDIRAFDLNAETAAPEANSATAPVPQKRIGVGKTALGRLASPHRTRTQKPTHIS